MSELLGIYIMFMVMRILIFFIIIKKGIKQKNNILIELGIILLTSAISYTVIAINDLEVFEPQINIISNISILIGIIIAIHWINRVFYMNRKSPYNIIMIILIPLTIVNIIFRYLVYFVFLEGNFIITAIAGISFGVIILIFGGWYWYSAREAFQRIKTKNNIEPWIKMRYKCIMLYSMCFLILGIILPLDLFIPIYITNELTALQLIAFIMYLIEAFGEFIAWYMPDKLKKFFNRNYTFEEIEILSEEEIMEQLGGQ